MPSEANNPQAQSSHWEVNNKNKRNPRLFHLIRNRILRSFINHRTFSLSQKVNSLELMMNQNKQIYTEALREAKFSTKVNRYNLSKANSSTVSFRMEIGFPNDFYIIEYKHISQISFFKELVQNFTIILNLLNMKGS
jgi:hypothetical protein